jgi:addiction module HigA family antidote
MRNRDKLKLTKEVIPAHATHPGTLIADELESRRLSQREMAEALEMAPSTLNEIIHGKRNLTSFLALKLEKVLDIDAAYWMRLQVRYEIDELRLKNRSKTKVVRRRSIRKDESQLLL